MSEEVRREVDAYGTVRYYNKDEKLHRLDGPAIKYANGDKEWWIDGRFYRTEKEWEKALCPSIEEVAAMFKEVQHER